MATAYAYAAQLVEELRAAFLCASLDITPEASHQSDVDFENDGPNRSYDQMGYQDEPIPHTANDG